MKDTETGSRKRKNKGSLSVFDEFTENGAGSITFAPKVEQESLRRIEERSKSADLPVEVRNQNALNKSEINSNHVTQESLSKINQRQTEDKVETKWRQTEDKVETLPLKTEDQKIKSGDKLGTQPETQLETKWRQTEDKVETKIDFSSLVGLQRKLILFLYDSCRSTRSDLTEKISIEHIAASCETSISSAKKTIQRLENRSVLKRKEFKNGRGGWTVYELSEFIYQDLLRAETGDKLKTNWGQSRDKVGTQPETQPRTTPSSSSSVLNISNKTTTQSRVDRLTWVEATNLDSIQAFGITKSVLIRCFELYPVITPEGLEELVNRFAEFMKEPKNRVKNARGFFIGLAKQLSEGITPLDHIETSTDRLMRECAEKLREKKESQAKIEKELLDHAYAEWIKELTPEGRARLVPESQFMKVGSPAHDAMLKNHFCDKVWPEKLAMIQKGELGDANL